MEKRFAAPEKGKEEVRYEIREKRPPTREAVLSAIAEKIEGLSAQRMETTDSKFDGVVTNMKIVAKAADGSLRHFVYQCAGILPAYPARGLQKGESSETTIEELSYDENGQLYFAETIASYKSDHFE